MSTSQTSGKKKNENRAGERESELQIFGRLLDKFFAQIAL